MKNQVRALEKRIETIKRKLSALGNMRPGSLSTQFNVCGNPTCRCKDPDNPKKHGPYYQLSYTHKMKSRTQYVRPEWVDEIRGQIEVYKRFKKLIEEWIELSIDYSQTRMK